MDQIQWRVPTKKLLFGLLKPSWYRGSQLLNLGFMKIKQFVTNIALLSLGHKLHLVCPHVM